MYSSKSKTVRLKLTDTWRPVLTDTLPFEVPIIFNNDGFYKNLADFSTKSSKYKKLVELLIFGKMRMTKPMRYNINQGEDSTRTLSLLHPHGQVLLAKFYNDFHQLICEYAGRSPFSIRKPIKVGRSYYFSTRISGINTYKNSSVDTLRIDQVARNPSSYFAYTGYSKLFKFFGSKELLQLEKRFKYQLLLDVAKCFDSIYTHSISWAVKDIELVKRNRRSKTFGNDFDAIMQKVNYDETSGICIGPEASRIFSEIILARADTDALYKIQKCTKLKYKIDFECRRYVDNYYIFANDENHLLSIKYEIGEALRAYKLHLNEAKTETVRRPFSTQKSIVIDGVSRCLERMWELLVYKKEKSGKLLEVPKSVQNSSRLVRNLLNDIKVVCQYSRQGYESVSNYIIGVITCRLIGLSEDYKLYIKEREVNSIDFRKISLILFEINFYFFTLCPTVASSYRLSRGVLIASDVLKEVDADGFLQLKEALFRWTKDLVDAIGISGMGRKQNLLPVEILNILLSLRELDGDSAYISDLMTMAGVGEKNNSYFDSIVSLYICAENGDMVEKRNRIVDSSISRIVNESQNIYTDAELTCLLLDLLGCPFIDKERRKELVKSIWPSLRIANNRFGSITDADATKMVGEFEDNPWFVRWRGVSLKNLVEKKEWSSVYA